MTDDELAAIRARAERATPGPWRVGGYDEWYDTWYCFRGYADGDPPRCSESDAEFTAHAREDVPALLAEVERLRAGLRAIVDYEEEADSVYDPDYWSGLHAARLASDVLGA